MAFFTKPTYRVRVPGWLYLTGYKQLSTVLEVAKEFDDLHEAILAARSLGRDEECIIIENRNSRIFYHDLLELEYEGK